MRNTYLGTFLFCCFALTSNAQAVPFTDIYIIGDSLSDQGNLYAATESLGGPGIPASDHYYQGRFADGEVYTGLLAEKLGLSLTNSFSGGNNFAYGGARRNYNIVETDTPVNPGTPGHAKGAFTWTLTLQKDAFASRNIQDPDALYVVFSGSNDLGDMIPLAIRDALTGGNSATLAAGEVVAGIKGVIETFAASGAHDIVVPNIPNLSLVPRVFLRDPLDPVALGLPPGTPLPPTLVADSARALVQQYNAALDTMLNEFTNLNIIKFDTYSFLTDVVNNPAQYGFSNADSFCYTGFVDPDLTGTETECADPSSYVFFDNEHPTSAFHQVLADHIFAAVVPEPTTLALVVIGLLGLGARANRATR